MSDLIEAMARAICEGIGLRSWEDTPADRGDLRARVRSGQNYDVNEPNRMDYIDGAKEALNALRETLVPVGYLVERKPDHRELDFRGLTADDAKHGWTEVPLFALPEIDNG